MSDPEADRFARELATAMDDRVSVLGIRAAMDRPAWAVGYLGEVPADPVGRADWMRRAGMVHAWHRADAADEETERAQALGEAEQAGALAQEVGTYREAAAEHQAALRRGAVRQDPLPSTRIRELERDEPELEAGL
jgi:hypothetical protein